MQIKSIQGRYIFGRGAAWKGMYIVDYLPPYETNAAKFGYVNQIALMHNGGNSNTTTVSEVISFEKGKMHEKRRKRVIEIKGDKEEESYNTECNFTVELKDRRNLESLMRYSRLPKHVKKELIKVFELEKAEIL